MRNISGHESNVRLRCEEFDARAIFRPNRLTLNRDKTMTSSFQKIRAESSSQPQCPSIS
jgi:hypothetical protein